MKSLFLILAMLFTMNFAHAGTLNANNAAEFDLNRAAPEAMQKHQLGTIVIKDQVRLIKAKYDFAKQGGAVGTVTLVRDNGQPAVLPKNAVIVDCIIDVQTTGVGAGTIALGTGQAGNDLKAALAATSYTGRVACIPVGTAATAIKLTADRTMTATIATGITNGKFNVLVQYVMSD